MKIPLRNLGLTISQKIAVSGPNKIDRDNSVFLSRIQLLQNPRGLERLRCVNANIEWDNDRQCAYILKGSTAHSLAILLGFEPYDNKPIPDGTYDRNGRVE